MYLHARRGACESECWEGFWLRIGYRELYPLLDGTQAALWAPSRQYHRRIVSAPEAGGAITLQP